MSLRGSQNGDSVNGGRLNAVVDLWQSRRLSCEEKVEILQDIYFKLIPIFRYLIGGYAANPAGHQLIDPGKSHVTPAFSLLVEALRYGRS